MKVAITGSAGLPGPWEEALADYILWLMAEAGGSVKLETGNWKP